MAIGIQAPAAPHIINAEVPTAEMLTYETLLERFSNSYVLTDSIEGGFFLRKKPLCGVVSVYSNWRTAIERPHGLPQAVGAERLDAVATVEQRSVGGGTAAQR